MPYDYEKYNPKKFFETEEAYQLRLQKKKEDSDRLVETVKKFADVLKRPVAIPDDPKLNETFCHRSVIVTYRANPTTVGEDLGHAASLIANLLHEKPLYDEVEKKLRALINADPNIDFTDYEDELGIKIVKVHRGPSKGYPGIILGSE